MKYLILVGDGMGDRPREDLGGRTLLEAVPTPHMDKLAQGGRLGLAQTIPPGMDPGSDTANMSLMGYDPARYHTGRSPIEAAAMGVDLQPDQIAFRCNLVSLDWRDGQTFMAEYACGHIDTPSAAQLIADLDKHLGKPGLSFHPGVSYRHLLVWRQGPVGAATVPPHDRSAQPVDDVLLDTGDLGPITRLTKKSWELLRDHPVNLKRIEAGKPPANSIWLWGQGTKPSLPTMQQRFGLEGIVVSAVDLIKGLGVLSGMPPVEVEGATGYLDTNYAGKVQAVLDGLKSHDMAFLHVEAPDEAGHSGELELKKRAIADFDQLVVGPLMQGLAQLGSHRVLLVTDHYTPLEVRTHTTEPVPFVIWDSQNPGPGGAGFNETAAAQAMGPEPLPGHQLIEELIKS
ncbi:MAG: cofactor-independent phosphoglycerate mutase [Desulfarculaceae bacterium]